MTEKQFLATALKRHGSTGDAIGWMSPKSALELAKEAGATFDPEPDWADEAVSEWYAVPASQKLAGNRLAEIMRKNAPKLPTVREIMAAYAGKGWSKESAEYPNLRAVLIRAGLPEGEP